MTTLQQTIDSAVKSFDEKFPKLMIAHPEILGFATDKAPAIKSFLISSIKKAVEMAYGDLAEEIEEMKQKIEPYRQTDAKDSYGIWIVAEGFNSALSQALSLIDKKKSLFLHECCDGECNHDDCCGKVPANCPLKDNK